MLEMPTMGKDEAKNTTKVVGRLQVCFWASGIIFLWVGSACFLMQVVSAKPARNSIPSVGDLVTVFFGASSLALIIFSLLLAIAAIIGWQSLTSEVRKSVEASKAAEESSSRATKDNEERVDNLAQAIEHRIEALADTIEKRAKGLEQELKGRVNTILGLATASVHSDPFAEKQKDEDRDYIEEAIHISRKAYADLKDLDSNAKWVALNNIVFYSCLLGLDAKRDQLLEEGRKLRGVALKYEESPWTIPYLLTWCRVVGLYGTDSGEVKQALAATRDLLETKLSRLAAREATLIAASLERKLEELERPAG
jgi:hypothetical protein